MLRLTMDIGRASDEYMLAFVSMVRVLSNDYDRTDTHRVQMFMRDRELFLDKADLAHSRSEFTRSSIAAAFDNDVKPLFFGEEEKTQ